MTMSQEDKNKLIEDELRFDNTIVNFKSNEIDSKNKIVKTILSDETPVLRFGWQEGMYDIVLSHEESAVDLSRAEIMPLLVQHNREMLPIGNWANIRIEDGKLKGDAVFDEEDKLAMEVFGKFERGFMKSFSIGIGTWSKVLEKDKNENGRPQYRATKWSLDECSVVTIPANANAKVGMNKETLRVNSASAQIKTKQQGDSMSKTYTADEFTALEATHAEALNNLNATHESAIQALNESHNEALSAAKTEQATLSKDIFAMAFERGLDKETAMSMLDKSSLVEAKAFMVDNMSTTMSATSVSDVQIKKDHWSDFKGDK